MQEKRSIIDDDRADDSLPLRFVITAILVLLIMTIATTAIVDLREKSKEDTANIEIGKLISNSEQLYFRGAESIIYTDIDIPKDTTAYIGTMPSSPLWPSAANNYYIQIGSRQRTYTSKAYFSNSSMSGPIILYSGPHTLKLETKKENVTGKIFVTISET